MPLFPDPIAPERGHPHTKFMPACIGTVRRGESKSRHHRVWGRHQSTQGSRSLTTGPPSAKLAQDVRLPPPEEYRHHDP